MRRLCKKLAGIFFCITVAVGCLGVIPASADETQVSWPGGPEVEAPYAIVMEASTGTVLYEKEADTQSYPASITKIMTTLLALENSSLDEVVTFSSDAVYNSYGSGIARDVGEQMTMEQCLYAVMLESANECSYAVAEHVAGGDYQKFIDMMNGKAQELGCTNTHFNNCNGLPDGQHITTCRDMALISRAALQNSTFRQIAGTVRYQIPPTNKHDVETPLNNHHQMISANETRKNLYEYCIGGKTGWTEDAGNTLVSFAEKDGMTLICVVMKCPAGGQYSSTRTLFDYCFENFKMFNVAQNETRYENQQDRESGLFVEGDAFAKLDTAAQIVLPATAEFSNTEIQVSYDNAADEVFGTLVYTYGGRQVGTADVVATGVTVTPYEFGVYAEADKNPEQAEETDSAQAEKDQQEKGDKSGSGKISIKKISTINMDISKKKICLILGAVGAAIVILLLIWYFYNNMYRIWRRRRGREKRYKTIKNNRKWNRRGGRRR